MITGAEIVIHFPMLNADQGLLASDEDESGRCWPGSLRA
jgi:hypothetical protein